MTVRILKAIFSLLIGLLALFYATQNVVNLEACYQAFAYVFSQADHTVYPDSFFPPMTHPVAIWAALVIVVVTEYAAGILATRGAWDLWRARILPADDFEKAKRYALLGCGLGVVVWLGYFGVFGAAMFQMWQTEVGTGSMNGAFQYFMSCAIVWLLIAGRND